MFIEGIDATGIGIDGIKKEDREQMLEDKIKRLTRILRENGLEVEA